MMFSVADENGFLSSEEEPDGGLAQGALVVAPSTPFGGWDAPLTQGARVVLSGMPVDG